MEEEMIMEHGEGTFAGHAEVIDAGNEVESLIGNVAGAEVDSFCPASDDRMASAADDVTSDSLMGGNADNSDDPTVGERDLESDSEMNREEEDVPWAGVCDDKCCRCNVNSSKGYW